MLIQLPSPSIQKQPNHQPHLVRQQPIPTAPPLRRSFMRRSRPLPAPLDIPAISLDIRMVMMIRTPVLPGVALLPPQVLEQRVEPGRQQRAEDGAEEVDPKVRREAACDDGRAEGARGVEGAAGEVDACGTVSIMEGGGEGEEVPVNSARKKAVPMPTGARYVPLCFSAASMMMTKTSSAVRNISMKSPWAVDAPPPSVVLTVRGPGKSAETIPAAAMPARSWETTTTALRMAGRPPTRARARVT